MMEESVGIIEIPVNTAFWYSTETNKRVLIHTIPDPDSSCNTCFFVEKSNACFTLLCSSRTRQDKVDVIFKEVEK